MNEASLIALAVSGWACAAVFGCGFAVAYHYLKKAWAREEGYSEMLDQAMQLSEAD